MPDKNTSVGRNSTVFYSTRTKMHILPVMMLHQHRFCVYKRKKRKLKILTACETFVLFALLVPINISFSFAGFKEEQGESVLFQLNTHHVNIPMRRRRHIS